MSIINILKENKVVVLLAGLFVLVLVLMFVSWINKPDDSAVQDPIVVPPSLGTLRLERTLPVDGRNRNTFDMLEAVVLDFSKPIELETLKYRVTPDISLKFISVDEYPFRVTFWPEDSGWEPNTLYTITITELESTDGDLLESPVVYTYYNDFPDTMEIDWPF
jgi:hypothetical protein